MWLFNCAVTYDSAHFYTRLAFVLVVLVVVAAGSEGHLRKLVGDTQAEHHWQKL